MRDELYQRIIYLLRTEGLDAEIIKSKLIMIMDEYEITERCTEIAVMNEDETEKYIRLFLLNKRVAGRTERTLKYYDQQLRAFFDEVRKSPLEITSDDIKLFIATKEVRDKISKTSQQNFKRVLSSFFGWMVREEHITKNPLNKVEEIKVPKVKKEAFSERDIESMRIEIAGDLRMTCIFELLLSTWCRVSELVLMKISDISDDMSSVIVHGKGQKDRKCYINERAKIYLRKYISERNDDNEYLFANCICGIHDTEQFYKMLHKANVAQKDWWKVKELIGTGCADVSTIEQKIRKTGKKAGVKKAHPHRFRRTGATMALRRGMPLTVVSKLLGHESIETTQIYLDITENELEQNHRKYV